MYTLPTTGKELDLVCDIIDEIIIRIEKEDFFIGPDEVVEIIQRYKNEISNLCKQQKLTDEMAFD